jgi:uncharacterized protein YcbK (DUF882 family)
MKRLLTVALGVALCSIAPAAIAAPNHIPTSDNPAIFSDSNDDSARPRSTRRSAARQQRRRADTRSGRRHASHRSSRQAERTGRASRSAARSGRRNTMAARSFTQYASPGTSRGCLTSSARALLGRIESQFGAVQIISTCRPGARIAGTGRISRHASGNAVDFNAGGRKAAIVRWLIANHKSGGTMTYAGMSHIHVDIGYHFVSLNSGGGRYR